MGEVVHIQTGTARRTSAPLTDRLHAGERLYRPDELARTIGVSLRTLRRWRTQGMPGIEFTAFTYRYSLTDVLQWRDRHDQNPTIRSA